jgi:N utilization substance protein A
MENSRELIMLVDAVSKEKGLPKNEILSFLSEGIEVALRKTFPEGAIVQVDIDPKNGLIQAWRLYELVDQIENVEGQMLHNEVEDEIVQDGYVWEQFDPKLTRQQFNITKQVALQKIKNHSREQAIGNMLDRGINIYSGVVKVIKKESLIVDFQGLDITIYRRNLLPKENFKSGQKIRFTLEENEGHYTGTRTSEKFLIELFKEEVSQIEDGEIEIVACARNPGQRSKIIVKSTNPRIEAARMCIGSRGMHVKNVQQEIPGEFIDIISYDKDPAQLLIKAIEPANVNRILIDEEAKTMEISVNENDIAQVIGRGGRNIEMISQLLCWNIKIYSDEQWDKNQLNQDIGAVQYFMFALDSDETLAQYMVESGFSSIEEIAYLSNQELDLDELDEETMDALKANAKETLADKEKLAKANSIKTLYTLGFNETEVNLLMENNLFACQDIADLSTYDLQDVIPDIDLEKAKDIIMKARQLTEV